MKSLLDLSFRYRLDSRTRNKKLTNGTYFATKKCVIIIKESIMFWYTLLVLILCCVSKGIAQDSVCRTEKSCDCCNSNPDGTRDLLDICNNKRLIEGKYWVCNYGCKDGYWGYKCWNFCPEYCTRCARQFGSSTIKPQDYQICFLCADGYYNGTGITNCSTPCPTNCAGNQCDKTTGHCLLGCKSNWSGDKCNVCADTSYGNNCEMRCPDSCKDRMCDSNGVCTTGCVDDNFRGSKCDHCKRGKYGENWAIDCPVNCKDDTCTRDDGRCTNGCTGNFDGDKCDNCQTGYYGTNCDNQCFNCLNDNCDRSTGRCLDCVNGRFGELCDKSCPTGCNNSICNRSTATCLQGCLLGLSGDKCCVFSQGCEICQKDTGNCESCTGGKFYGDKCDSRCPSSCLDDECSKENGACIFCKLGYYGKTCNMTCPNNCLNNVCGQYDGICHNCSVGYYSRSCDFKCPSVCINATCNQESGDCTLGCRDGKICNNESQTSRDIGVIVGGMIASFIFGVILTSVLCFIWRRRQTKKNKKDPAMHVNAIFENDKTDPDGYEELQIPNH